MKTNTLIMRKISNNPILSVLVLIGFLSIQFHSFLHIDSHVLHHDRTEIGQLTESNGYNSDSDHEDLVDCPECVLSSNIFAAHDLPVSFIQSDRSQIIQTTHKKGTFENSKHHFQLRAPPLSAV